MWDLSKEYFDEKQIKVFLSDSVLRQLGKSLELCLLSNTESVSNIDNFISTIVV